MFLCASCSRSNTSPICEIVLFDFSSMRSLVTKHTTYVYDRILILDLFTVGL